MLVDQRGFSDPSQSQDPNSPAQEDESELDLEELGLGEGEEQEGSPSPDGLTDDEESWVKGEVEKAFYNVKDVPPELQPSFREMKSALTKAFQKAASTRRGSEESAYKAALLDRLSSDPRFQQFVSQAVNKQAGPGELQGEQDPEEFLNQAMESKIEPLRQATARLLMQQEMNQFMSSHPDYKSYLPEMRKIWQEHPRSNVTAELAYQAAKARVRDRFVAQKKAQQKASVETPGAARSSRRETSPNSIREAFLSAVDEVGMDRKRFD